MYKQEQLSELLSNLSANKECLENIDMDNKIFKIERFKTDPTIIELDKQLSTLLSYARIIGIDNGVIIYDEETQTIIRKHEILKLDYIKWNYPDLFP